MPRDRGRGEELGDGNLEGLTVSVPTSSLAGQGAGKAFPTVELGFPGRGHRPQAPANEADLWFYAALGGDEVGRETAPCTQSCLPYWCAILTGNYPLSSAVDQLIPSPNSTYGDPCGPQSVQIQGLRTGGGSVMKAQTWTCPGSRQPLRRREGVPGVSGGPLQVLAMGCIHGSRGLQFCPSVQGKKEGQEGSSASACEHVHRSALTPAPRSLLSWRGPGPGPGQSVPGCEGCSVLWSRIRETRLRQVTQQVAQPNPEARRLWGARVSSGTKGPTAGSGEDRTPTAAGRECHRGLVAGELGCLRGLGDGFDVRVVCREGRGQL